MFGFRVPIDPIAIQRDIADGTALLVDVRTAAEWNDGHAQGAIHVPAEDIMQGTTPTTDESVKLYVYCRSGGRAGTAARLLQEKGYTVENIGGLSDWVRAGGVVS